MPKYLKDPRIIPSKFDCKCAETGKLIKKGENAVYYPLTKQIFHLESEQAQEFREWKADVDMGHDY